MKDPVMPDPKAVAAKPADASEKPGPTFRQRVFGGAGRFLLRQAGIQTQLPLPIPDRIEPLPDRMEDVLPPGRPSRPPTEEDKREVEEIGAQLKEQCTQYSKDKEAHEKSIDEILAQIPPEIYSRRVIEILFGPLWAEDYDRHMASTGHDDAIEVLLKQALLLDRYDFSRPHMDIIGDHVLEMSAGSGSVIDMLCRNVPDAQRTRLMVTANDLSDKMKEIAREKIGNRCDVRYESQDLRELSLPSQSFDTVILSQTLHLIAAQDLLALERDPTWLLGETDHREAKIDVIRRAFHTLKAGGHFLLIDEWPAVLSNTATNPVELVVSRLFQKTFRPIVDRATIRNNLMKDVPNARFVAELKVPIDKRHSMYLFVYQKKDPNAECIPLPSGRKEARKDAITRLIGSFRELDVFFREAYERMNGSQQWKELLPIKDNKDKEVGSDTDATSSNDEGPEAREPTVINPSKKQLAEWKYDTIILSQRLHHRNRARKMAMIEDAIHNLNVGGSLIIVDEWEPPKNCKNQIRKREFRDELMERFQGKRQIIFEGALRTTIEEGYEGSGMYGYLYRKIRDTSDQERRGSHGVGASSGITGLAHRLGIMK